MNLPMKIILAILIGLPLAWCLIFGAAVTIGMIQDALDTRRWRKAREADEARERAP